MPLMAIHVSFVKIRDGTPIGIMHVVSGAQSIRLQDNQS
jgi:hypothetical protein